MESLALLDRLRRAIRDAVARATELERDFSARAQKLRAQFDQALADERARWTVENEAAQAGAEARRQQQVRLFTPASGPAWSEPMLKAFLSTCLKVNCLGRTWRESAARRLQSSNLPDPREAELIRRLIQRWQ